MEKVIKNIIPIVDNVFLNISLEKLNFILTKIDELTINVGPRPKWISDNLKQPKLSLNPLLNLFCGSCTQYFIKMYINFTLN